jgi:hypothetical protein
MRQKMPSPNRPRDLHAHDIVAAVSGEPTECAQEYRAEESGREADIAAQRPSAWAHAETVIDSLEDTEDYRGFEAAIMSDYNAETAVERELVLRLASLLWRLRRIIAIETDLFQIQAEILRDRRNEMTTVHGKLSNQAPEVLTLAEADRLGCNGPALSPRELTHCFLRLGNLDGGAFERLGRYNAALWKQTAQTLLLLGPTRRR